MHMKIDQSTLRQIESDLGLNRQWVKGQTIPVRNCWHFSTDGNAVDAMFYDEQDFRDAMNGIYVLLRKYKVIILAFVLMDTHVHFILYGELEECNRFIHDLVARLSRGLHVRYGYSNKLSRVPVNYQKIDSDRYLKTAICYVVRNPTVAGLSYMPWNYPWSSGPLYFHRELPWSMATRPKASDLSELTAHERRKVLKSRKVDKNSDALIEGLVLPQEYVAVDLVERVFRTASGYNFFLCTSRESDVESREGRISRLSIPMQEMRQHRIEICRQMYGRSTMNTLNTEQRLRVARALRAKYNSSAKQLARLCGLIYEEVKDMI